MTAAGAFLIAAAIAVLAVCGTMRPRCPHGLSRGKCSRCAPPPKGGWPA